MMNPRCLPVLLLLLACRLSAAEPGFPFPAQVAGEAEGDLYGGVLRRMREPALAQLARNPKSQAYRFLLVPAFGNAVSIRVARVGDIYRLAARRLDGKAGQSPGRLAEQTDLTLSGADAGQLARQIELLRLFDMPTEKDQQGRDGEDWVVQGVEHGKYHAVSRWCAGSEGREKRHLERFVAFCTFLYHKSGLTGPALNGHDVLIPAP